MSERALPQKTDKQQTKKDRNSSKGRLSMKFHLSMNREHAKITECYLMIELKIQAQAKRSVRGQLRAKRELGAGRSSEIR
jgi:hypothetical protein